jgi:fumarate reductase subunit C
VSARVDAWLWIAQRASAVVLAVCVVVHLATVIYAVQGGLDAAEILGRTRGNVAWLAFYSVFVLAVAVHAPIGLRSILGEWLGWRGPSRTVALALFSAALLFMGARAVAAVFSG